MSNELRHDPNGFQFTLIQNMNEEKVNFFLFLNVFFPCLACNTVPENRHIYVSKGLAYLILNKFLSAGFRFHYHRSECCIDIALDYSIRAP